MARIFISPDTPHRKAGPGVARLGAAGQGEAWLGKAWIFETPHRSAWLGVARQGRARQGMDFYLTPESPNTTPHGVAGLGRAGRGKAGQGLARHGWARQGMDFYLTPESPNTTPHGVAGRGPVGQGWAWQGMDFQMKRTGHTSVHRGKAVVVYMRDGRQIHGVYSEGRGRFIVLTDGRKILKSEMRCVTIDKEQSRHGKAPRGTAGPG